jgi:hypothetical protein
MTLWQELTPRGGRSSWHPGRVGAPVMTTAAGTMQEVRRAGPTSQSELVGGPQAWFRPIGDVTDVGRGDYPAWNRVGPAS